MNIEPAQVEERVARRLPPVAQPAWRLISRTVVDTAEDRVHGLAAEAAFFALLSLPPLLLVVVGAFSYVRRVFAEPTATEITSQLLNAIEAVAIQVFTTDTVDRMVEFVDGLLASERLDILSLGFVVAFWSGSRATSTFITAITIAYDLEDPRPVWKRRVMAFGLTLGGSLAALIVFPALALGPDIVAYLAPRMLDSVARSVVDLAFWPGVVVVSVALLTVLYHVGVPWSTPWRRDVPGAVLAVSLWVLGSLALRYYVGATIRTRETLETLATPLVGMLWLYVTAFAVLLGGELNAEIERLWPHDRDLRDAMASHQPSREPGGAEGMSQATDD